jgi:hypothetical protein
MRNVWHCVYLFSYRPCHFGARSEAKKSADAVTDFTGRRVARCGSATFGRFWVGGAGGDEKVAIRDRAVRTEFSFRHPARGASGGPVWAD